MGNNKFKNRIRQLRTNKELSMDQFANELGINKSRISMWENNGTVPRDEMLISLSRFFGVSIDYLLGNDKMEEQEPDNKQLKYLQRNLEKLNDKKLDKAEKILSTVFDDIFNDEEEDDEEI